MHGGIPLEELERSCVKEPGSRRLWLLHRRAFAVDANGEADPKQKVPLCQLCLASLRQARPTLPKFALANDLWIGGMPDAFKCLSEGALLILPIARALIRRMNCKPDGAKDRFVPKDQMMKGYVGNACAFQQGDGGHVLKSLPPRVDDVVSRLVIAFTGSDEQVKRTTFRKELGVSLAEFQAAYNFLIKHNYVYEHIRWDHEAAADLARDGVLGLPAQLAACVYHQEADNAVAEA